MDESFQFLRFFPIKLILFYADEVVFTVFGLFHYQIIVGKFLVQVISTRHKNLSRLWTIEAIHGGKDLSCNK